MPDLQSLIEEAKAEAYEDAAKLAQETADSLGEPAIGYAIAKALRQEALLRALKAKEGG